MNNQGEKLGERVFILHYGESPVLFLSIVRVFRALPLTTPCTGRTTFQSEPCVRTAKLRVRRFDQSQLAKCTIWSRYAF